MKLEEIEEVTGYASSKYVYFISIKGKNNKEMALSTAFYDLTKEDVIKAFREIIKYQPEYKFIVNDRAGWVKE